LAILFNEFISEKVAVAEKPLAQKAEAEEEKKSALKI